MAEGSVKVEWSTTDGAANMTIVQANVSSKKLKIHKYFNHYSLSPDDFTSQGNIEFGNSASIQTRGGWPYYPPVFCKRYGLNVSKKYDNGSDQWLLMDGNEN